MENEITLNGITYVKKEEKIDRPNSSKIIAEQCHVMGIVKDYEESSDGKEIKIESMETFKLCEEELKVRYKGMKPEVFYLEDNKYSWEFLQKAIKTSKAFTGNDTPHFYNAKKDYPCLITFDKLVFMLAPRVEN